MVETTPPLRIPERKARSAPADCLFASLDLTYWWLTIYSPSSAIVHFAIAFLICLFGLRWALLDQGYA